MIDNSTPSVEAPPCELCGGPLVQVAGTPGRDALYRCVAPDTTEHFMDSGWSDFSGPWNVADKRAT